MNEIEVRKNRSTLTPTLSLREREFEECFDTLRANGAERRQVSSLMSTSRGSSAARATNPQFQPLSDPHFQ